MTGQHSNLVICFHNFSILRENLGLSPHHYAHIYAAMKIKTFVRCQVQIQEEAVTCVIVSCKYTSGVSEHFIHKPSNSPIYCNEWVISIDMQILS